MDPKILVEKPNKNLDLLRNKNFTVRQALDNDCTHVMLVDEDIVIESDTFIKLFNHDKDIITGLYLTKSYPHFPSAFSGLFEDGNYKIMYLDKEVKGLISIISCQLGCILIKMEVFKKLQFPWFDNFFERCADMGFKIFCDTDTRVGHKHTVTLWPGYNGEKWYTEYKNDNGNILVPQMIPFKGD